MTLLYPDEAERVVLGSAFGPATNKEHVATCLDALTPQHFFDLRNREVFCAVRDAFMEGEDVTLDLTVLHRLRRQGSDVDGLYLFDLLHHAPTTHNARAHIGLLEKARQEFELKEIAQDLDSDEDIQKAAARAASLTASLRQGPTLPPQRAGKAFGEYLQRLETEGPQVLDLGLGIVLPRGTLGIVGGQSSQGKSALLTQMALHLARAEGRVFIESLEMSQTQLLRRIATQQSRVMLARLAGTQGLEDKDWLSLSEAHAQISKLSLLIDEQHTRVSELDVMNRIRLASAQLGGLDFVVIDYVQMMTAAKKTDNRTQELAHVASALRHFAAESGITIMLGSQLSREIERSPKKRRPQLSDLRDSGGLEQAATFVVMIHRPDKSDGETKHTHTTELIVRKNSDDELFTVDANFTGPQAIFEKI